MDIATDFDCADLVKEYRSGFFPLIEWQLKTLCARERIDMVVDLVVVWETHFRADHDRQKEWDKFLIDLIHYR
jgi:hypothetical protein